MITIISRHYCKEENLEISKALLNTAGLAQSKFKGYISRETLAQEALPRMYLFYWQQWLVAVPHF